MGAINKTLFITSLNYFCQFIHGFLYYTRTDFMPFVDSQKKKKKAKIYSVFLYPVYCSIYYNKDRCVFIYLFRVTLSVISTGENSCPPYCGYRFKYLRK